MKPSKAFMFSSDEINKYKSDPKDWHNFVRRKESEIIFSLFPENKFKLALELGAGNGGQSIHVLKHCEKLICTDLDEKSYDWLDMAILDRQNTDNVEYKICDAQDLSQFDDNTFDLIFSSNMLEHIPDVRQCLRECKRVLKEDGVMLHTMPSRYWKFFQSFLNIASLKPLDIHGVSTNQWQEFKAFGFKSWVNLIKSLDLKVADVVGLPFYVGHGNRFIPIIKAGNSLKLSATYLYIVRK
ncbi:class I SAM-dependent methyltransferase [Lacinutrix sp. WUR7]|uniref:class I SAM-dependent methyltransferase n=1 Tax=Lacinutrix sp. WUR7 TaxID=2653681 RepID=UPI00193DFB2E|nr:class I SAM-dependent methyltransferase [Lacinutrix sp. WUR7]